MIPDHAIECAAIALYKRSALANHGDWESEVEHIKKVYRMDAAAAIEAYEVSVQEGR